VTKPQPRAGIGKQIDGEAPAGDLCDRLTERHYPSMTTATGLAKDDVAANCWGS
jgi:hypothetical protein